MHDEHIPNIRLSTPADDQPLLTVAPYVSCAGVGVALPKELSQAKTKTDVLQGHTAALGPLGEGNMARHASEFRNIRFGCCTSEGRLREEDGEPFSKHRVYWCQLVFELGT
eukprot:2909540-Amphidinium_carterae.1